MTTSSPDLHQFERLRPLGALEQFSSARHDLGLFHNVGLSGSYVLQSQNPIVVKEVIFSALSVVIRRHPVLSAIPVDEHTPNPYFVRLPQINLEDAVTFIARELPISEYERDTELDALLEAQHNLSFKAKLGFLPFWRLIILFNPSAENEFVASFIFHHALGDGGSGLIFHKHFLSALSSNPAPLASKTMPHSHDPLLPPLELLHPLPVPPPAPAPYTPEALWVGTRISPPKGSHFRSLTIAEETTTLFIAACRQNGTTVTATMPVIIASILLSLLPAQFADLECTIPVNLRRWLPEYINDDVIGTWIDAFSQHYQRSNVHSFSWAEARRSREIIVEYLKSGGQRINVAKFKMIPDMRAVFLARMEKEGTSSFDVSNLGGVKTVVEGEREWTMGRMVFSRSAFATGSAFSTGLVTGADGSLVLGFCWQEGVVDTQMMEAIVEEVKSQVERLALLK